MSGWIVLAIVAALGVGLWRYQKKKKAQELLAAHKNAVAESLVGLTGTVASARLDEAGGTVRLVDHAGQVREVAARLEDAEGGLARGAEILVIETPVGERPAIVVPNELPRLEDMA